MAMLCLFGICIPYSVIWPFILLFFKQIWDYIYPSNNKKGKDSLINDKNDNKGDVSTVTYESSQSFFLTKSMSWSHLITGERTVFVRFTAKWCKPCKEIEPLFDELSKKHASASFVNIDVDEFDELAAEYGAISIPLFVCLKKGEVLGKFSGKDEIKLVTFIEESMTAK